MQVHLDIEVDDLDAAGAHAVDPAGAVGAGRPAVRVRRGAAPRPETSLGWVGAEPRRGRRSPSPGRART
jgi:hypothetical protein